MAAAGSGLGRLLAAVREEGAGAGPASTAGPAERARFIEALEDDFSTPRALAALFDLARTVNRERDAGADVRPAQAELRELAGVLGLQLDAAEEAASSALDAVALSKLAARHEVSCGGSDAETTIEALLARRQQAREERDFALADAIRADLAAAGIEVEDTPRGARWSAAR